MPIELDELGVTAQVLFKHGYESGLQLVVRKLASSGVLQGYLRPTTCRHPDVLSAEGHVANVTWLSAKSHRLNDSKAADGLSILDKQNCGL